MKIAIMGAGGIGAYTGGRLAAAGQEVAFIARGAHLAALRETGLTIRSGRGDVHLPHVTATADPASIGVVDLVIFSVKLWDTESAAQAMRPMIGPQTLVVTFQNGIDSADLLARYMPREQVVRGAYYISAHVARPGVIDDAGVENRMLIEGLGGDARIAAFKAACEAATGLVCEIADPAVDFIWRKFVGLTAFSGVTALLRKPIGEVWAHPLTRGLLKDLVTETATIALARGVHLPPDVAEVAFGQLGKIAPGAYASMAVDLLQGRRLELPWLSGRVHALGAELGIPTPAHTSVYRGLVLYEGGRHPSG
ncbi:MAG: 2-dehydropantoate 2-reductase [Hyphomicrobiales bacterium]|nr:MAG: 2-dehydropantoate 2-reductase [Hyphomicrobiales bacterium]